MRGRLVATFGLLLLLVPAAALLWIREGTEDRLAELHLAPQPVEMAVSLREDDGRRSVAVTVEWGDTGEVAAPAWFGLVTEVRMAAGDTVGDGDVLVVIDGVSRPAVVSPVPFHRHLVLNDRGPDVETLQGLLNRFGYLEADPNGVFDRATLSAVQEWGADLGVVGRVSAFDPGWVIWLPVNTFEVGGVLVEPGRSAPGLGEPIVVGTRSIASIDLLGVDRAPLALTGEWVLETSGVTIHLVDGMPEAEDVALLTNALDPSVTELTGVVRLAEPRRVIDVPAAAVVVGADGKLCVYRPDGGSYRPVPVVIGPGSAASVAVLSGLTDGDLVLANPGDLLEAPACR